MVDASQPQQSPLDKGAYDVWLVFESTITLYICQILLKIRPFEKLGSVFGKHMEQSNDLTDGQLLRARRIARAVAYTQAKLPFTGVCLTRSMAIKWLLNRRRIPSTVYLGVGREAGKEENSYHAWVRFGTCEIGAHPETYTVVASFS